MEDLTGDLYQGATTFSRSGFCLCLITLRIAAPRGCLHQKLLLLLSNYDF